MQITVDLSDSADMAVFNAQLPRKRLIIGRIKRIWPSAPVMRPPNHRRRSGLVCPPCGGP